MTLEFFFPDGSLVGDMACLFVTILPDNRLEDDEYFELSIDGNQNDPVFGNDTVLIKIMDANGNL